MTVAVELARVVATGNGATTVWPFNFPIYDPEDLEVYLYTIATRTMTGPISNTLYSVTGIPGTGSVTYPLMGTPLSNAQKIIIRRRDQMLQPLDYSTASGFDPDSLEEQLDRMVMMIQQNADDLQRAVKVDMSNTDNPDTYMDTILDASAAAVEAAQGAATSEGNAANSAATASADAAQVAADKIIVAADKATVAADKGTVAADKAIVAGYRDEVEADRVEVQANKVITTEAADAAAASAATALAAKDEVLTYGDWNSRYIGEHATDPINWNSTDPLQPGTDPLIPGLVYFNTGGAGEYRTYSGSVWQSGAGDTSDFARRSLNGTDYTASTFRTNLDLYSKSQVDGLPAAAATKATPIDADSIQIVDSAAAGVRKRLTFAALKTYLNALYQAAAASLTSWAAITRAAGFDTFTATPTSANLRALLTDETGTGVAVFATQPTIANPIIDGTIREDVFTITDAAGFVINPANGSIQRIVLGANRTPTVSGWNNGDSVTLLIGDGTDFTITWTTIGVVWKDGVAPVLATTGFTEVNITREGNVYRGVHVGNFAS